MFTRSLRWGIVLFLLATLPAMTVAQAQEPAAQVAPAAWNVYESEPNDTIATADPIALNDVVGGELEYRQLMEYCGSDYFRFSMDYPGYAVIEVSHYNRISIHLEWAEWYDSEFQSAPGAFETHLLFVYLNAEDYVIELWDDWCGQGDYRPYELSVYRPLLVSAAPGNLGTGTVSGIQFKSEDVLSYAHLNNGAERWQMLFDGSDVGVKTLTNLAVRGGDLLFSVSAAQTLPGVGTVKPHDIVRFAPDRMGQQTQGTFSVELRGSQVNLTTTSEKLDAIEDADEWAWDLYYLFVSTTGVATGDFKFDDEDVVVLERGFWENDWVWESGSYRWFDIKGLNNGNNPRIVKGLPAEDVIGLAYQQYPTTQLYMTIQGTGNILNHAVNQKDIFAINFSNFGWGGYLWRGPQHGWNYNLDAFEFERW